MKDDQTETIVETSLKHKKKRKHEAIDNNENFEEKQTENMKGKKIKQDLDDENDMKTLSEKKMNKKHKNKNKAIHKNDINNSKEMDTDNKVKKKRKQKLDNEKEDESLLEKKQKKKRKHEETEENTSTDNVDKKKQKKMKKKQELTDNVDLEQTESSKKDKNKENTNKAKKKKKKKNKDVDDDDDAENKEETKTGNAKDSSLEYLKLWSEKRHKWKFQKVRQTWLLKHCYNKQKVSNIAKYSLNSNNNNIVYFNFYPIKS